MGGGTSAVRCTSGRCKWLTKLGKLNERNMLGRSAEKIFGSLRRLLRSPRRQRGKRNLTEILKGCYSCWFASDLTPEGQ